MGLDQYLNKVVVKKQTEEVQYWRKNNQLQGWFEQNADQENCVPTPLNRDTIHLVDKLLEDFKSGSLQKTEGFFYGSYEMEPEEYQELIELFTAVKKDIEENDAEYEYNCWY